MLTRLTQMSASYGHSAGLRLGFCARSHVESPLIGAPKVIVQVSLSAIKGGQVMAALDQFLVSNPDMVEKSYGDVMAACLVGRSHARRNKPARSFERDRIVREMLIARAASLSGPFMNCGQAVERCSLVVGEDGSPEGCGDC
jgi:hypothetical protein